MRTYVRKISMRLYARDFILGCFHTSLREDEKK